MALIGINTRNNFGFYYVNDFSLASKLLDPIIFPDDTNLFYSDDHVNCLFIINELQKINWWFISNKISLTQGYAV